MRPDPSTGDARLGQSQRRHRVLLLLLASLLVLAGASGRWLVLRANERHAATRSAVAQSQAIVGLYRSVLTALLDAQNGGRGYVVTGDDSFLVQYDDAISLLDQHLRNAAGLAQGRLDVHEELLALEERTRIAMSEIAHAPEARRVQGFAAAQAIVASGEGQRAVEGVRDLVSVEVHRETELLERLRDSESAAEARSRRATDVILIVGFGALAAALWLIRREGLRRLRVEREIEDSRRELQQSLQSLRVVLREREQLRDLSELVQSCRSLQETAAVLEGSLPRLLPAAGGNVSLLQPSRDLVEPLQSWGEDSGAASFEPDHCWALRRGRVYRWLGPDSGPRCSHWDASDRRPYVCHPLVAHGETQGVFSLVGSPEPAHGEDRAGLEALVAETIGLAVTNMLMQETLRHQSIRDPLTGLFNRRYLEHTAERELARARRRGKPLALILCDLDHFKRLNDEHGHEAGDAALSQLGALLRRSSRGEDVACRYGGEEFVLLMPEAGKEAATERAELLRREVRRMDVQVAGRLLPVLTASFGVATSPEDGAAFDVLLRAADLALYQAKRDGRDRVRGAGEAGSAPPSGAGP